jgi:biotin transport system substrate-specific component
MTAASTGLAREAALGRRLTLADVLLPANFVARVGSTARDIALVVAGAILIAATANFSIPVPGSPVPVTGQTFSVLLVSGVLGARRGLGATGLYLLMGLLLPVYAQNRSGVSVFGSVDSAGIHLAATGGYLVGFLLASAVVGRLAELGWDRRPLTAVASMLVGNILIYAVGLPWLAIAAGFGPQETVAKGLVPFLIGDALKLLAAGALLPAGWWLVRRRPSERAR